MLDFNAPEFLVVAIVALVVIGPNDLPKAMRAIGKWVGRARGVARQFRSGFDTMMREAELAELEKQWAAENERIMREHPPEALPAPHGYAAPPAAEPDAEPAPLMVEQPEIRPAPEAPAEPVAAEPAPAPVKTRKPRAPRAKAES